MHKSLAADPERQTTEALGEAVLVVDDEHNFLSLLRWFLSNRGYAVEPRRAVNKRWNCSTRDRLSSP